MTWTTPRTWAVGDMATAADMNTYVRDNSLMAYVTPQAHIAQVNAQSFADNTHDYVVFDEIAGLVVSGFVWDNYGQTNLGVSPTAIYCVYPGYYLVNAYTQTATSNSSGVRVMDIMVNRTYLITKSTMIATGESEQNCTGHWYFNFGDFIELDYFQNSGGALSEQFAQLSFSFQAGI